MVQKVGHMGKSKKHQDDGYWNNEESSLSSEKAHIKKYRLVLTRKRESVEN